MLPEVFPTLPNVVLCDYKLIESFFFKKNKVHASVPSNTFALYGNGEEKELTELVPGILNQLGPDSLKSLRKLAESYQNMQKSQGGVEGKKDEEEDDIPDLVEGENFENNVE